MWLHLYSKFLRVTTPANYAVVFHSTSRNFYDILEISPKATHAEIKAAYFRQTKKFHPDVSDKPEAAARFRELSEAYETLRYPDKRRMYDRRHLGNAHEESKHYPHNSSGGFANENSRHRQSQHYEHASYRSRTNVPPKGRWEHYNFDEWHRAHYGESERSKAAEARRRESIRNFIKHQNDNYVPPSQRIIRFIPFLFFNVALVTFLIYEMD